MKGYREKEFFQKDRKCPETKVPKNGRERKFRPLPLNLRAISLLIAVTDFVRRCLTDSIAWISDTVENNGLGGRINRSGPVCILRRVHSVKINSPVMVDQRTRRIIAEVAIPRLPPVIIPRERKLISCGYVGRIICESVVPPPGC